MEMMVGGMYAIRSDEKTYATRRMFLGLMLLIMLSALGHLFYLMGVMIGGLIP